LGFVGLVGFLGLAGLAGFVGLTGFFGLTGLGELLGLAGLAGSVGLSGLLGLVGLVGLLGLVGLARPVEPSELVGLIVPFVMSSSAVFFVPVDAFADKSLTEPAFLLQEARVVASIATDNSRINILFMLFSISFIIYPSMGNRCPLIILRQV
jgi:hypothetical protein